MQVTVPAVWVQGMPWEGSGAEEVQAARQRVGDRDRLRIGGAVIGGGQRVVGLPVRPTKVLADAAFVMATSALGSTGVVALAWLLSGSGSGVCDETYRCWRWDRPG